MNMFANLKTQNDIQDERNSVGGGAVLESGLYKCTIGLAYATLAESGARGLVIHAKPEEGRDIRQTLWMSSGTAKGGNNFYIDAKGQKQYLAGFITANALALLTVGKEVSDLEIEEKVAKIYSREAKAEVPQKVPMCVELIGKEVVLGIIKQTVDKTAKNDATGKYESTGESRDENEIDKVFRAKDLMTVPEVKAHAEEATFHETWAVKWNGQTRDRRSKDAAAGKPAAAPTSSTKPKTSLFAA